MKNPFLSFSEISKTEYLTSKCSLNRAIVAKAPISGVDDEIEGKNFKEIFSTRLIGEEIKRLARYYALDFSDIADADLPRLLDTGLLSDDIRMNQLSERVAVKFGNRLGLLLLTLSKGEKENRDARDDWDDACWEYWKGLRTVILTGGLSSSMLGRRFKEQIQYIFDISGQRPYDIRLFENGAYLGVMGAAQRLMKDDTAALALDLGQTNFKRAVVRKEKGRVVGFSPMETLKSEFMERHYHDPEEKRKAAISLHRSIVKNITLSFREAAAVHALSDEIIISIASYTHDGILDNRRGGYSKLNELGDNYAKILGDDLSGELHKKVSVRLVHDGTATALYFSDTENAVTVTLGTAFGVGFPDIRLT